MAPKDSKTVHIKVDKESFDVDSETLTGAEIRQLPSPPIGTDRDLYLSVPGPQNDRPITDDEVVGLKNGMHFYTAPSTINPG